MPGFQVVVRVGSSKPAGTPPVAPEPALPPAVLPLPPVLPAPPPPPPAPPPALPPAPPLPVCDPPPPHAAAIRSASDASPTRGIDSLYACPAAAYQATRSRSSTGASGDAGLGRSSRDFGSTMKSI